MNISRFFGATNREAMRQVRLALGPEALIISNKRINGGVEILATDQTPDALPSAMPETPSLTAPQPSARAPARPPASSPLASQDLIGAIGDLRGSLESRIDELLWGNQLRRAPGAVTLFQALLRFGFSTALLRAMLKRMPEGMGDRAAFQWARAELVKHLPVLASEDALWQPGLALALVGPTGVGKTTTIAKLAARCVRRAGPGSLVLLTTDTYRIGAHEQLKIYGEMLRVPVHVVQDITEMRRIVQGVRPDQTILIDNVGISQRDQYVAEQAALLAGAGRPVSRLLVLNASSHGDTLDEVARSYAGDGGTPLRGCVITKLDEATRLGGALDTAIRYQLPIHYVSNGQKVPEHLLFLSAPALLDYALAPTQGARTLYAPTEADLAALLSMTRPDEASESAVAARRQKSLLPRLLSTSGGQPLDNDALHAAVAALDEDAVLSEGYDLWHTQGAGTQATADGVDHLRHLARQELGEQVLAVVVHGRIPVRLDGRGGTWLASAWCGPDGRALAASSQQLLLVDGGSCSVGVQQAEPLGPAQALMAQIAAEGKAAAGPMLQVFDGGTPSVWRALEAQGLHWLAQASARTRVHEQGEAASLSALCRRMATEPLRREAYGHQPMVAGLDDERVALWVGVEQASIESRSQDSLPVQAVCLKALDRQDGRELRAWYALASVRASRDPQQLGRALLARIDCQAAWRQSGARLGAAGPTDQAMIDRCLAAAQWGLAGWRLWRDPGLAPAAGVCAQMLGQRALTASQTQSALMKLYALKEMLD